MQFCTLRETTLQVEGNKSPPGSGGTSALASTHFGNCAHWSRETASVPTLQLALRGPATKRMAMRGAIRAALLATLAMFMCLVAPNTAEDTALCPRGYYQATGLKEVDCVACPRGRYGETIGLTSRVCTSRCPPGRYRDTPGATSAEDCRLCPPGKYGSHLGLTTKECSGPCPVGKYSSVQGLVDRADCVTCPVGYRGWQCTWPQEPRRDVWSSTGKVLNEESHVYVEGGTMPEGRSVLRFDHTYTPLHNSQD